MKLPHYRTSRYRSTAGQVLVLFLLFSVVLLLFVGLGIDLGFAYITKARLSKALDAASLAAVSNYSGADKPPGATAVTLAKNTFWANYGTNGVTGLSGGVQVQSQGTFTTDPTTGNLIFSNTASATINTFFIGLLPQWKTLTVGDTSVATRSPVVMTLVLDRSGSMDPSTPLVVCQDWTEGGKYLASAATQFIDIFDETLDQAAVVSFATTATTDLPMTKTFKTGAKNVPTIVNNLNWNGYTCSECGLTNALLIQNAVKAPNAVKAVVFFTDGQANTIHGTFNKFPYLFGLQEGPEPNCHNPNGPSNFLYTNGLGKAGSGNFVCSSGNCGGIPGNCGSTTINVANYTNVLGQANRQFCASMVVEDAMTNCVLLAQTMRANSNYVYSVGLTAKDALNPPDLAFLQSVANDPDGPSFDPTQPVGAAFQSTGNDLSQVFQQVAADIILRLVR